MKKLGVLLLGAFLLAGCQSEEEKAAARAAQAERERIEQQAREERQKFEQQEMAVAKDRVEALEGRFEWNVRRRSTGSGAHTRRYTRCNVKDLQDGSEYRVDGSGASLQSGPGTFLRQGQMVRSGSTCMAFDSASQVYCVTGTSDVPECRPYSLMPEHYRQWSAAPQ